MPALRPALLTAALSLLAGLVLCYLIAATAGGLSLVAAARIWLVAHGSALSIGATDITVVPLGATLVAIAMVVVVARWMAVEPIDEPALFMAAAGGFLGVAAGVVASVASIGDVEASVLRASIGGFVVGMAGAAAGYSWRHGVPAAWQLGRRPQVLAVLATAGQILTIIGVAATIVVMVLLATHAGRAGDLWAALDPGFGGGIALLVANLLALPTLVVWAAAVLIGPGVALGTDSTVDLTGAHVGEVPALPVLAALPAPGEFSSLVFVLGLIPLAAALAGGVRLARTRPGDSLRDQAIVATLGGAVAGLVLAAAAGLSAGSIGPGRMAEVGPPVLSILLVAVPTLAAGAALGAVAAHYRVQRAEANRRPGLWRRHKPASAD